MELLVASPLPLIVGGGFVIGFLIGITGVGAGSLTTPLLISGVGIPPHIAVGTDLLFAAATKASAAWRHQSLGNVNWPILGWLAAGSIPGAALVLAWMYLVTPDTVAMAFYVRKALGITLIFTTIAMLVHPFLHKSSSADPASPDATASRPLPTALFGVVLGAFVALTSVGAGAIGVAVLTGLYPYMLVRRVVGTDIVHAVPLTFLAGLGHSGLGHVDLNLLGVLLCGSIPGILIGSRLTGKLPDWALRIALGTIMLFAAYNLLAK